MLIRLRKLYPHNHPLTVPTLRFPPLFPVLPPTYHQAIPNSALPPSCFHGSREHVPTASRLSINSSPNPAVRWSSYMQGRDIANHNTLPWRHSDEQYWPIPNYAPHHTPPRYDWYNCGEFNHRQATCRYHHRRRCGNCCHLGHKGRLCQLPIT